MSSYAMPIKEEKKKEGKKKTETFPLPYLETLLRETPFDYEILGYYVSWLPERLA